MSLAQLFCKDCFAYALNDRAWVSLRGVKNERRSNPMILNNLTHILRS